MSLELINEGSNLFGYQVNESLDRVIKIPLLLKRRHKLRNDFSKKHTFLKKMFVHASKYTLSRPF